MKAKSYLQLAGAMSAMLMVATARAGSFLPSPLQGNIDGVVEDGTGGVVLKGWACWKGVASTVNVDVSVGGVPPTGVRLGTYAADQSAEAAVASACGTTSAAHRFVIPIDAVARQRHAGLRIDVQANAANNMTVKMSIGGSGQYTVPAPKPTGGQPQDDTVYVITDRLGSQVVLTDSQANVIFNVDYKAYGAAADLQHKIELPGYTGHYEDTDTGLTYMQARYYDADLGRFMSPDPAAIRPGDLLNFGRYVYADANPVNYVDPDGRIAGVHTNKYANAGSGVGTSGTVYVTATTFYSGSAPSRSSAGVSWSNGGGGYAGGGGGAKTLPSVNVTADASAEPSVATEAAVNVTATIVAPAIPRLISWPRPVAPPAWLVRGTVWGLFFVDANGFHDWIYGTRGCYGTLQCSASTEAKPKNLPPGTIPVDRAKGKYGWDTEDLHKIKGGTGAGPRDWTGVSPDGHVWTGDGSGDAVDHGHWEGLR